MDQFRFCLLVTWMGMVDISLVRAGKLPVHGAGDQTSTKTNGSTVLHDAVRELLGFQKLPDTSEFDHDLLKGHGFRDDAPRYMMQLYEEYKYGTITKGRNYGNTLRSINAQIGKN